MNKFLIIMALLVSGCSHNHQKPVREKPTFDPYARVLICHDESNKVIKVLPSYETKRVSRSAYATYNRNEKRREIIFSVAILDKTPMEVLEFMSYHECGHHQLNHVKTTEVPEKKFLWSDEMIKEEYEADCFAAVSYWQNNGHIAFHNLVFSLKKFGLPSNRITQIKSCIK